LRHKIHNYDPIPTLPYLHFEEVVVVEVIVVVVEVEVVEATELEVMDHPIVPKLDHTGPMTITVGPMDMIVQRTMTVDHVSSRQLVTK
jgi:hypothetical protein